MLFVSKEYWRTFVFCPFCGEIQVKASARPVDKVQDKTRGKEKKHEKARIARVERYEPTSSLSVVYEGACEEIPCIRRI